MSKNIIKRISSFIILGLFLILLVSCGSKSKIEEAKANGNVIKVTYDANGGTYLNREGITLIDMFNPDKYQADSKGTKHIKLLSPVDEKRPSGGSEGIYITRTNYFLVGWYQNRTLKKNSAGNVVNEKNQELILKDNEYYLKDNTLEKSTPRYTYSGYWDFSKDTIDYTSDMKEYEMTLYAVWSPYFTFDYYYEKDGNWEYFDTTSFDYVTTNQEGSKTFDKDTIWVPRYVDGAMNYTHNYANNSQYKFPQVEGYTFDKAYTDKSKTQMISDSFEHKGYIDYENGVAVNPNQSIYITLTKGSIYHISTAQQLINNPDLNGIYVIENDLDFEGLEWPKLFAKGTFNGQFYADSTVNIKNITIKHNEDRNAKFAGVFGAISSDAMIKNINFSNVTLDLQEMGARNRDSSFGLFAGEIEDNANISNVSISGSIKIGNITPDDTSEFYLVAGGNTESINAGEIHVSVYGIYNSVQQKYKFTIDPTNVIISEGVIKLISNSGTYYENEIYVIQ